MFVLDATTRTLEVLLDAAPATSQLPVVVTYADVDFAGASPHTLGSSHTLTSGTTAVAACAAPAASTQRQVEELTVRNDDTAARVVTLRYNDNGTFRRIATATLQPGETLEYTHAAGLRALADGAVKMSWTGTRIANGSGSVAVIADGSVAVASATNVTYVKNGASPQALRVYNADTGGVADEWGAVRWNANVLELGSYANGTGTLRALNLVGGNVGVNLGAGVAPLASFDVAGTIRAGGGGLFLWRNLTDLPARRNWAWQSESQAAGDVCLVESAANNAAPSVPRFQVQSGGSFVLLTGGFSHGADNSYDYGFAGAGRPRSVYVGTSVELGGTAWVRGDPGRASLTADATNATTTLSNLSDLSRTLVAGRRYNGRLVLKCSNSTATGGVKLDFGGGTATATSFWAVATPAGTAGSGGAIVTGTLVGTTLTSAVNYTTITGETLLILELSIVCSAGGTLVPRIATNSAGTVTARLGSSLELWDSPN